MKNRLSLLLFAVALGLALPSCASRPPALPAHPSPFGPESSLFPDTAVPVQPLRAVPSVLSTDPPAFGLLDRALRVIRLTGGVADGELWAAATIAGVGPRVALSLLIPGRS
jgi:hypothetical protein